MAGQNGDGVARDTPSVKVRKKHDQSGITIESIASGARGRGRP